MKTYGRAMRRLGAWIDALGGVCFFFSAVLSGCSRKTPEPAGSAAPVAATTTSTAADPLADRCVRPMNDTPPPAVSAVSASECPRDPDRPAPLRTTSLTITTPSGAVGLDAELAITADDTERGLMYRREMAENHGMFFLLGARKVQTFWMHNTCIPLDMLFVDQDGLISGILENVPPMNDAVRSVGCATPYVLEMNAGWSRKHGVRPGQKMTLPRL